MAEKKADKIKLVKGTTSSGLKYQINPNVKDDVRILMFLRQITNETVGEKEKTEAFYDFMSLIFGDQVPAFLNEVAARHNGVADITSVTAELNEILTNVNLKNS